jgi:chorismate dehydratase
MALKIGQLTYSSGLAVSYAFTHGLIDEPVECVTAHQDELDVLMAAGKLVAGPVSSLEYIRHGDRYSLVKDLSIGSWGRIGSSILFSREPFAKLNGQTVALPPHGATSNALTRWLLDKLFGVQAHYVQTEGSLKELLERYPAALLIGDQAVVESRHLADVLTLDMGECWWQAMHTPFVHTVWVTQADQPRPERDRLAAMFQRAKAIGKSHHAEILKEASLMLGLPSDEVEAYFALLNYDLTPAHMQGLGLFADYIEESEASVQA